MIYRERIDIQSRQPEAIDYLSQLRQDGYGFEEVTSTLIRCWVEHIKYGPELYEEICRYHAGRGMGGRVSHSISPQFDPSDEAIAPLREIGLPDIWIDDVPSLESRCAECGASRIVIDTSLRTVAVTSASAVGYVNGEFPIISRSALQMLEQSALTGVHGVPFDNDGNYFYFMTRSVLDKPIVRKDEFLSFSGCCPSCGSLQFEMAFGPPRFSQAHWNGDDLVWADHLGSRLLGTPRAIVSLRQLQSGVFSDGLVFLE